MYPPTTHEAYIDLVTRLSNSSAKKQSALALSYLSLQYPSTCIPRLDSSYIPSTTTRRLANVFHALDTDSPVPSRVDTDILESYVVRIAKKAVSPSAPIAALFGAKLLKNDLALKQNFENLSIPDGLQFLRLCMQAGPGEAWRWQLQWPWNWSWNWPWCWNWGSQWENFWTNDKNDKNTEKLKFLMNEFVNVALKADPIDSETTSATGISKGKMSMAPRRKNPVHDVFVKTPSVWRLANLRLSESEASVMNEILKELEKEGGTYGTRAKTVNSLIEMHK